jgi:hypothetical protein
MIEFKLGQKQIEEGAEHSCQIENLAREKQSLLRIPDLKIVISGTECGYRMENEVLDFVYSFRICWSCRAVPSVFVLSKS